METAFPPALPSDASVITVMTHSWFTGFTNVDNPELVISVITEGSDGSASGKAVVIAKQILDSYYN